MTIDLSFRVRFFILSFRSLILSFLHVILWYRYYVYLYMYIIYICIFTFAGDHWSFFLSFLFHSSFVRSAVPSFLSFILSFLAYWWMDRSYLLKFSSPPPIRTQFQPSRHKLNVYGFLTWNTILTYVCMLYRISFICITLMSCTWPKLE